MTDSTADKPRRLENTVRYRTFPNGTVWPCHRTDLGWRLRYAQDSITRTDKFVLASIVEAYAELIETTQVRRNEVCKNMRVPND